MKNLNEKTLQIINDLRIKKGAESHSRIKDFFRAFSQALNFPIRQIKSHSYYSVCYYDMSEFRIEVTDMTPFYIIPAYNLENLQIEKIFYQIKQLLYSQNMQEKIGFIYINEHDNTLKELVKSSYIDIVVLNDSDIIKILSSDHRRRSLLRLILDQCGISIVSPYSYTRIPFGSMFYGRKDVMQKIVKSNFEVNFSVIGSRRIGKTSLILNIKKYLDQDNYFYTIFLDCYRIQTISEFIQQIASILDIRSWKRVNLASFYDFMRRMRLKYNKKFFLILDEVDELVEFDKNYNWELSRLFHSLATEEICKIIIAGYRKLYREINNQYSPMFKYFEQIYLKELDSESARKLILEPLDDIGIKINDRNLFSQKIMELTANHPQFIQFICSKLVESINNENKNELSNGDIKKVEQLDEYFHFVIDTLIMNADDFQQLYVYEMADFLSFDEELIINQLAKNYNIELSLTSIQRDCLELELANIFKRVSSGYTFAYPALPKILKENYNLTFKKERIVKEILSDGKFYVN